MTLDDEKVMWMLRECAKKAGYQTRLAAEGFVGVIGPAKVCKLLGLIHAEVVDELVRTSAHIAGLNAEIDLLRSKCPEQSTTPTTAREAGQPGRRKR